MPPETQQPIGEKAIELLALGLDLLEGKPGTQGERGEKGETGEKGDSGEAGKDGQDGVDGINGKDGTDGEKGDKGTDGKDGKNGKDGKPGKDGKDAPEINDIVQTVLPTVNQNIIQQVQKSVSSKTYSANEIQGLADFVAENGSGTVSFETVSKNLSAYPNVLNYTGENLTSIVYTTDTGTVTKTLDYTGDNLTSITLSGDLPSGIETVKTLSYTGDNLTGIAYS